VLVSRLQSMLCGQFEMSRMAKEAGKFRCQQTQKLLGGRWITSLRRAEERIQSRTTAQSKPLTSARQNVTMTLKQVDARKVQGQSSCPVKLLAR